MSKLLWLIFQSPSHAYSHNVEATSSDNEESESDNAWSDNSNSDDSDED